MAELHVESLCRRYGGVTAVDDVSFTVREGEFLTLLGPSGCGKSTTLSAIAGLERPTSGRIRLGSDIYFDGAANVYLPPERRNCGLVFQSYALWPHMTVAENCAFPLKLRKVPAAQRRTQVDEALALVEMQSLADRYPHQLSGGQQQRVALARTLVFRPGILLLDEPLSNLDAKLRDRARTWLKHLQNKVGLTTVYVTHDQIEALAMSDRIAVMDAGRIIQLDTPQAIYRSPANQFVADFIGASNLVEGTLETNGGHARVRYADGQALGVDAATGPKAVPGKVMTAIRPESIRLLPGAGMAAAAARAAAAPAASATATPAAAWAAGDSTALAIVRGRLVDQSYLGARFSYQVEALGAVLRVEAEADLPSGDVALQIPPSAIVVFPVS